MIFIWAIVMIGWIIKFQHFLIFFVGNYFITAKIHQTVQWAPTKAELNPGISHFLPYWYCHHSLLSWNKFLISVWCRNKITAVLFSRNQIYSKTINTSDKKLKTNQLAPAIKSQIHTFYSFSRRSACTFILRPRVWSARGVGWKFPGCFVCPFSQSAESTLCVLPGKSLELCALREPLHLISLHSIPSPQQISQFSIWQSVQNARDETAAAGVYFIYTPLGLLFVYYIDSLEC